MKNIISNSTRRITNVMYVIVEEKMKQNLGDNTWRNICIEI